MRRSLGLSLYLRLLDWTAASVAKRIERKGEGSDLTRQRLGHASLDRPKGPLIWIHLASDAEAMAVLELIQRCREEREELSFLLTSSGAVTPGFVDARSGPGVLHQRAPADYPPFVARFLDHWRPDICTLTEGELRAALIDAIAQRDIPLFLIDASLSAERQGKWRWLMGAAGSLLTRFDQIFVADPASYRRFRQLGAPTARMEETGVLEEGTAAMACDEDERDRLALCLSNRPVWLGAYVSPREVDIVTHAHRTATRRAHRLLLIIVPKDLSSGDALARKLEGDGWIVAQRKLDQDPDEETQILIADLPDEMGLWYRLAPVTFLGSSLDGGMGCNPFEPAALGSAVLHGPNVSAYRASYDRLGPMGAARQVSNARELSEAVEELLAPDRAADMAHAAWLVCSAGAEVTDRVKDLFFETLDTREAP